MSSDNDIIREDDTEALGTETEPLDDVFTATVVISREDCPKVADVTAEPQVQVGSLLRERFLLQEEVDGGGMGVVYKALDRQRAESDGGSPCVAIKVLSPKLARNEKGLRVLQQEATKVRCLTHPHIVRFIDFDHDGDQYFLVMEWLEGRTLANILDSVDARNIDRIYAMRIVRQIGDALDYAHRCGIVHADVKPGNVMILPSGAAKLFDFGTARVRQTQSAKPSDSEALSAATPAYASMQVLTGEVPAATDDVFSLACLLYRLIAGYRVFGPRNAADAAQEGMAPQRPQGFTDGQWSAMRKALSYSRVTRFASMNDFISALDVEADQVSASPSLEPTELDSPSHQSKLPVAAVLLLLVIAVGGVMSDQGQLWLKSLLVPGTAEAVISAAIRDAEVAAAAATNVIAVAVPESTEFEIQNKGAKAALQLAAEVPETTVAVVAPQSINSIGFSVNAVQVRESEPAVQIDVVRDGSIQLPLTIGYSISSITATEGVDYFAPSSNAISFAAGQDAVRLLIPLVQDFAAEGDESFVLRLGESAGISSIDGFQTAVVTIRDDEPQIP